MRPRPWVLLPWVLTACPSGDDGSADPTTTSPTTDASTGPGSGSGPGTTGDTSSGAPTTGDTSADDTATDDTGPAPLPARLGVTADWLARTLTVIDLDALAAGAQTREEIVAKVIDLSDHAPGPLEVELAPDGVTAVVSVSPGFFGGFVGNLIGVGDVEQDGTLLVVDLQTEAVTAIPTVHVPMGIAIAPDGSRAYTANYGLDDPMGGSTLSVIDLASLTVIEEVEVGPRPEQVSLSPDGTVGMLNVVGLGAVRAFETADPSGTLGDPLEVGADPSDVAFVPGTPYAVVTNSLDPSNHVVVDASDPAALVLVVEGPSPVGATYGATSIPGTADVLLTVTDFSSVYLHRITVAPDGTPSEVWQTTRMAASFPLGVAVDPEAGLALMPGPGPNVLWVQDLESLDERELPWQDAIGPTYVALPPP